VKQNRWSVPTAQGQAILRNCAILRLIRSPNHFADALIQDNAAAAGPVLPFANVGNVRG
jgi:hypothetical protein